MYNYEEGIYEHVFGDLVGGHAMRIEGWGHDSDGNLFWKC
jgi:cathepsin B